MGHGGRPREQIRRHALRRFREAADAAGDYFTQEDRDMFNVTNHASARALRPMFEAVQIQFDWPQVFRTPVTKRSCDKADLLSGDPANELAILLGEVTDPYERAVQALRDVRHLLPSEGVAIVDAVLDCAT
jgi:hypothetical protein